MKNTFDDFQNYRESYGINMNKVQLNLAKELFDIPLAGGKTLLISLLYAYDPSAERVFNNMRSERGLCPNIR